jgi:hypothetical protein
MDICKNCRFWMSGFTSGGREYPGDCRRHPPVAFFRADADVDAGESDVFSAWPPTSSYEWCGEHETE